MTISKRLYSSIALLVIGAIIVKTNIIIGDGCRGMIEGLLFLLFSAIDIVTLVIALIVPLVKRNSFNCYPLVSTAIVIVVVIISF